MFARFQLNSPSKVKEQNRQLVRRRLENFSSRLILPKDVNSFEQYISILQYIVANSVNFLKNSIEQE